MARRSPWEDFVGNVVRIVWHSPEYDWPYFRVLNCSGKSATLRGEDYPDGSRKHDGSLCDAMWGDVKEISAISEDRADSTFFDMENGVLDRAKKLVDGRDKAGHYGLPEEFMLRLAKSWSALLAPKLREDITGTDAALMMNNLKSLRLVTDPEHEDSEVDLHGYGYIFGRVKRYMFGPRRVKR